MAIIRKQELTEKEIFSEANVIKHNEQLAIQSKQ